MNIELVKATEADFDVVRNLFQLYVHDLSEFMGWDIGESGRFGDGAGMEQYWGKRPDDPRFRWGDDERGYAFVLRAEGKLAGFVLIKQLSSDPPSHDVGEFFVLRKFRGKGAGKKAAHRAFDLFPGNWQVRELLANTPAQAFWRRIIDEYTGGDFVETTEIFPPFPEEMIVQRFANAAGGSKGGQSQGLPAR